MCGHDHWFILTESNNLYVCGLNTDAQLSNDSQQTDLVNWGWSRMFIDGELSQIKQIVVGDDFNFCQWGNLYILKIFSLSN